MSILKKTSLDIAAVGDYCTGGPDDFDHPQNPIYDNNGFVPSDTGEKSNYVCDYLYEGYTLEITNTVRILPIFEKSKNIEDIQPIDKVVGDDSENIKSLENNAIETSKTSNKKAKRVQFWGYER